MKPNLASLCLLSVAALLQSSCNSDKASAASSSSSSSEAGYKMIKEGSFQDKEYSEWLSKAGLQQMYDQRKPETYFAYVEGRNNGGLHEYRHVTKAFPSDKYSEFAVFWGLSSDEFYQMDLKMLRNGFVRTNTQVFTDGTGNAFHQVVWLKPKP